MVNQLLRCDKVTEPRGICSKCNSYFSGIGNMLQDKLNKTYPDGINSDFIKYCDKPVKDSTFVSPVDPVFS